MRNYEKLSCQKRGPSRAARLARRLVSHTFSYTPVLSLQRLWVAPMRIPDNGTNRAWVGTNRAQAGTNRARIGTNPPRGTSRYPPAIEKHGPPSEVLIPQTAGQTSRCADRNRPTSVAACAVLLGPPPGHRDRGRSCRPLRARAPRRATGVPPGVPVYLPVAQALSHHCPLVSWMAARKPGL